MKRTGRHADEKEGNDKEGYIKGLVTDLSGIQHQKNDAQKKCYGGEW